MKRTRTSLFFAAVLGFLVLWGSAWGVESSESIQGMISHWKFDEGQGSTAYDSAGDNHGNIYGAVWTTGQIDGALSFDGVDDYVRTLNDIFSNAQLASGATLSAWFNTDSTAHGYIADNEGHLTLGVNHIYAANPNKLCGIVDGGYHRFFSSSDVTDNLWHHAAIVWDGTDTAILYLDGVNVSSGHSGPPTPDRKTRPFTIGTHSTIAAYFNGLIDDVRIYDRALSAAEIWQLYQGVSPELVGFEIIGTNEVAENLSASYKAIAYYDNNSTRDVTNSALWVVEPNTYASINENGVLTTKDIVRDQAATILASYTEGDVTVEAEKAIDIFAICPTGTALQFDGVDDYVDCGNDESLNLSEVSISAWVKTDSLNRAYSTILTKGNAYDENYGMYVKKTTGVVRFQFSSGGSYTSGETFIDSSTNILDMSWHHVVGTFDGSVLKLYIDSLLETTGSITTKKPDANIKILTMGVRKDATPAYHFNGVMDEVVIFNRALSAEEIRADMHRRLAGDEPGLVGYWDFDEGEGQIVYDLSGNGNDGQLGSTPNPDASDPAWVDSDAPIGICSLYQIATMAVDRAVERKTAMLEELLAALAEEWTAYEALEELLEGGDYGDLNKGDIVKAKQKIHSATQHEEQAIDALEKSIEKLEDALNALGYEPEPPPPPPSPPGRASNPNPADGATGVSINTKFSWTTGPNAVSYDVYFGMTSPGMFRGNQTATTFDPGAMAMYTTYYWRIDEVNPGGTTTGTVWSFTTTTGGPPPT